ncbi:MAG: hypothetical protein AB9846_13845 [Tenuifilaceae bacterium]
MKNLTIVILICIFFGCKEKRDFKGGKGFLKDSTISSYDGILKDSMNFHFPNNYYNDSLWIKTKIDKFHLNWYSSYLKCFKAPILYNYYLGYESYRFLWLRSFNRAVLITLTKENRKIVINTKILSKRPNFNTILYNVKTGKGKTNDTIRLMYLDKIQMFKILQYADSIALPKYNVEFAIDTSVLLNSKNWNEFNKLIEQSDFWQKEPYVESFGLDGSEWVLEGQVYEKYHFVSRWSPKDNFRKCCEYLIKISSLKNEEIY